MELVTGATGYLGGRLLRRLLDELELLDREGRFGAAFDLRDRLRDEISAGHTPEGMMGLDWGLWWALVEELDRLQPLEVGWIRAESSSNGGGAGSSSSPRF